MYRRVPSIVTTLLLALAAVSPVFAQAGAPAATTEPLVENPQYASWVKHKPGTTVVMTMNTNMAGQSMNMEVSQKLVQVTPDKATVEVTTKMGGNAMPAQQVAIESKVPQSQAEMKKLPQGVTGDIKELAKETLTVAGKSYDCKVYEFSGEQSGMKSSGKVWQTDQIPGGTAKVEMQFAGEGQSGDMKMHVASIEEG